MTNIQPIKRKLSTDTIVEQDHPKRIKQNTDVRAMKVKPYQRFGSFSDSYCKEVSLSLLCIKEMKCVQKKVYAPPKFITHMLLDQLYLSHNREFIKKIPDVLDFFICDRIDLKKGIAYFLRQYGLSKEEIETLEFDQENRPNLTFEQSEKLFFMMCEDHGRDFAIEMINGKEKSDEDNGDIPRAKINDTFISLWDEIDNNPEMDEIFVARNDGLYFFPRNMVNLKQLKNMEIESHCCVCFPKNFSEIQSLETLEIEGDGETSVLPQNYPKNLKSLSIVGVVLDKIPDNIFNISQLEGLYIYGIDAIPKDIGQLKNLTILELSGGALYKIPESIGELDQLEYLGLYFLEIKELPKSVKNLKQLREVCITDCTLEEVPLSIIECPILEKFSYRRHVNIREKTYDNFGNTHYSQFNYYNDMEDTFENILRQKLPNVEVKILGENREIVTFSK